jgi:hypothetical protein
VRRDDEAGRRAVRGVGYPPPLVRAGIADQLVVILLPGRFRGGHPGQVGPAVRVQGAVQHPGHQADQLVRIADRPEGEPPGRRRDPRSGPPLQAQPFDEQLGAGAAEHGHPVLGGASCGRIVAPVRRQEPQELRGTAAGRQHRGQRGAEQALAVRRAAVAVQVEDVHQLGRGLAGPGPPRRAGDQAAAAQRHPHPLRAAAAGGEVAGQLCVQDVREPGEQGQLVGPGDRAQDEVGHGASLRRAPVRRRFSRGGGLEKGRAR